MAEDRDTLEELRLSEGPDRSPGERIDKIVSEAEKDAKISREAVASYTKDVNDTLKEGFRDLRKELRQDLGLDSETEGEEDDDE